MKVRCTSLLSNFRGQIARSSCVKNVHDLPPAALEKRIIDAEQVHVEAQDFWLEKQWFYRGMRRRTPLASTWDRFAQVAIMLSRPSERLVPEAAFRLLAVFLKVMLVNKIVENAAMMLPVWQSVNAQNVLNEAVTEREAKAKKDGTDSPAAPGSDAAASATQPPATPPPS